MLVIVGVVAFLVAFCYAVFLGIPVALLLRRFGAFHRRPMCMAGMLAGLTPVLWHGADSPVMLVYPLSGAVGGFAFHWYSQAFESTFLRGK